MHAKSNRIATRDGCTAALSAQIVNHTPHGSGEHPGAGRPIAAARLRLTARAAVTAATVAALAILTAPAGAVPIADLHANDANGVPAAPYTIGTPVSISGIVTVPDSVFNNLSTAIHVQDETAGIYIFQSGGVSTWNVDLGDSVTVDGNVGQFLGLSELINVTDITLHSQGHAGPAPLELTCAEVNATFDTQSFREDHESRLIRIRDVSLTGGTWPQTPGNGSTLTITDSSGSTTLVIAKDSELNGTSQPPSVFDVTGVIQQLDSSAPHTTGYRIMPRYLGDISGNGPIITSGPTITELTETTVRLDWTTATPATSIVELGPTDAYGDTFEDGAFVTVHSMLVDPIADASWHHFRVGSNDGQGTTYSADGTFLTQPATDEAMMVFFNRSIDPAYAAGKVAAGNVPFPDILIYYFNQAQYSIDAMFYSLSLPEIADALVAAHLRGIEVRVIKDATTSDFQYNRLLGAGIPAIKSNFPGSHSGIHHNKAWVIDARDATSTLDDWVITGSWNPTFQGTDADAQNIVVIKDTEMAEAYTLEFNEMWGSSTNTPNAATSRFGNDKTNNTPHQFVVNGIPVEMYFAPTDLHENFMMVWIGQAQTSAYFSILAFTRDTLSNGLRQRYEGIEGFEVRGVFDDGFDSNSEYPAMNGSGGTDPWSPRADVLLGDYSPGFLHHKYMILDSGDPASDPMVLTGSANFSNAARISNDENQLHIHDYDIARVYLQEFAEVYHRAGGTGELGGGTVGIADQAPAPASTTTFALRNVPNPFNPSTTIRFELAEAGASPALSLYDATGRTVRDLELAAFYNPGSYSVTWDGTNNAGQPVASGVYFSRLTVGERSESRRMVLAR